VTTRRLGGWLVVTAVLVVWVGGVVWNGEHAHRRTVLGATTYTTDVSGSKVGIQHGQIRTGPAPDHAPAIWLFVIGGGVAVGGAFLMSRPTPATDVDDRPESD